MVTGVIWLTEANGLASTGRYLAQKGLQRAAAVWALSPAQVDVLSKVWHVPMGRLHFLPFGIDSGFWQPGSDPRSADLVVSAGNDRHRDHALLVEAMRLVKQGRSSSQIELVTKQPILIPPELGVKHREVTHRQLRDLYRRATVVGVAVKPNLHVSGITVVLEAMACECAVVVSDTAGMSEYVRQGETGVLVPPGDPTLMADAIAGLLADPPRARALGEAARKAVEQRFSTKQQAVEIAGILSSLASF